MQKPRFRIWLWKEREMVYPEDIDPLLVLDPKGQIWVVEFNRRSKKYEITPFKHDFAIFFSTECKDKNGQEIYEGDIVKDIVDGNHFIILHSANRGFCGVRIPNFDVAVSLDFLERRGVVVGNVKENYKDFSKLLRVTKIFSSRLFEGNN
jgi:hypothetical protein